MKLKIIGFLWISGLLLAILVAIIVQSNRLLRAIPYAPEVQDVRVVNDQTDRVRVELPEQQTAQEVIETVSC